MKLHAIWIGNKPLPTEHNYFDQWGEVNPALPRKLWTEAQGLAVLEKHFPETRARYDLMRFMVGKIGMLRFAIVYAEGGIYMDLDCQCLKPFNGVEQQDLILSQFGTHNHYPLIADCYFGSAVRHPIWKFLFHHHSLFKGESPTREHAAGLWGVAAIGMTVCRYQIPFTNTPMQDYIQHHNTGAWHNE